MDPNNISQPITMQPTSSVDKIKPNKSKKAKIAIISLSIVAALGIGFSAYSLLSKTYCEQADSNYSKADISVDTNEIDNMLATQLVAKYIGHSIYEGQGLVLKALAGDFKNEDYMVYVAYNNVRTPLVINGTSRNYSTGEYYYGQTRVGKETIEQQIHQLFGNNYNMSKKEYEFGCGVNLSLDNYGISYIPWSAGCGGTEDSEGLVYIKSLEKGADMLKVTFAFAEASYNGGDNIWSMYKNNNGSLIEVKSPSTLTDSSKQDARQYLVEHMDDFNTYKFTFSVEDRNLILTNVE